MNSDDASPTAPGFYYRYGLAVLRTGEGAAGDTKEAGAGSPSEPAPEWMAFDDRIGAWVAPGHRFPELRAWAAARGVRERLPEGEQYGVVQPPFFDPRSPRDYQAEALRRWRGAGGRGSVVLPTGSGKSFVAILAIHEVLGESMGAGACIVVPTRALLEQWFNQLADAFGVERVGAYYGEEKDARSITVTTYHSAFNLLETRGRSFGLLVLDEAHHLADTDAGEAKAWHDALRIAPAARRLGLTATYPEGRDSQLRELVGPIVYRREVGEMVDQELADFALERRFVALSPDEREQYDRATEVYEGFMEAKGYRERYPDREDRWRVFMSETRRSPRARRAFRAFLERERIVQLAEAKLEAVGRILRLFPGEQALVFCGATEQAEAVSRRLALPLITGYTPASERKRILDWVESGEVQAVVSVRVLDEGWDVPSAKLGLILGDTTRGGRQQHRQRLGRILRRQGDRVASLYELVVADTHEFFASQKRSGAARRMRDRQLGLGF